MIGRLTSALRVKICPEKSSLRGGRGKDENHRVPNPSCMVNGPKFPHRNFGPGFQVWFAQESPSCRRITASLKEDWDIFCCRLLASFLAWRNISAVNVSPCSSTFSGRTTDEPRKMVVSTLQADGVTLNSFPWFNWWECSDWSMSHHQLTTRRRVVLHCCITLQELRQVIVLVALLSPVNARGTHLLQRLR
jgi:hypothetical protein